MRFVIHLGRMILEVFRYGLATRRASLVVLILVGLGLLALALTAQVVAPLALYPFA